FFNSLPVETGTSIDIILLLDLLPYSSGTGKRDCPPEDCGSVWGHKEFLDTIKDPGYERHEELLEWINGEFDQEHFDLKEVYFDEPGERRKIAMEFEG
ncbi:MAG: hypothetical protein J7M18_03755, partial [Candidatus Eremiobacteraeota bacterium]|nr:hypothetical protein [Candidatus Eremiobacteraeota bacterium]